MALPQDLRLQLKPEPVFEQRCYEEMRSGEPESVRQRARRGMRRCVKRSSGLRGKYSVVV